MATIQWRPEVNALTTPQSYKILHVPRGVSGYNEMAADISATHPNFTEEMIKSLGPLMMEWIQTQLINGSQVTFPNAFTFNVSFNGRLDSPDAPLPESADLIQVNLRVSQPFIREIRHQGKLERLPMSKKLPLITSAEDTKLKLADVLNPAGLLRLTGSNLRFEEDDPACGCVIAGTESGEVRQSTFGIISNSEILLAPDIPAQAHPWNNEYTLRLTAQYTEHGTLRTGAYARKLRAPLTVHGLTTWTGILTGKAAAAHVSVTGGSMSADTVLRIQAVLDLQGGRMLFSLLDMQEGGAAGAEVSVTQNGEYILPGFAGSPLASMEITVNSYAALWEMIRNDYSGRLVDILDVRTA